ncbi:MAG: uncharacterized sporulation protein YeaH/YhbH (DUF444 family) [Candidatus Krumholzibacteriia bacterium]|jgi:uncharacterized sporulation protein YeaH/YhbH (DUF444 family)
MSRQKRQEKRAKPGDHKILETNSAPDFTPGIDIIDRVWRSPYAFGDLSIIQAMGTPRGSYTAHIGSLEELMERDKQREEDGFPRKIRIGKLVKPSRGGQNKVVVVPSTVEEKFIHDPNFLQDPDGEGIGGSGDGAEGEVIGEQPVRPQEGEGEGTGPGKGDASNHELESNAYDLGKILTEQFALPNLQDKGKKRSLTRVSYDLTDRNRGTGQLLDKRATLRQIVRTNIALGRLNPEEEFDTSEFLVSPRDKIYRILSPEKDLESQAMVFFLRDYSGSMSGKPTEVIVNQHVMIYSWIMYQYAGQVESRFILHDTEAKEVDDFYTYYNSRVAGGTKVAAAFTLVNEIVKRENLARDFNIYVFHGTDGDDWDTEGEESLPEIEKMMTYASRIGVTIAENSYGSSGNTEVEKYLKGSGLLEKKRNLIRLDVMNESAEEPRIIQGIKSLISE